MTGSGAGKATVWPAASLYDLGRDWPSTVTAPVSISRSAAARDPTSSSDGQEPVETVAGGVVRHRQRMHQTSSPGGPPGSAEAPWSSRPSPTSSSTTPTTMKQSARLNVGQCETWMKSVT